MQAPILVLNKNAKRDSGRKAQQDIITATKAVSDIIRSTLGPRAMLKMLLDPNGSVILTADGASILREIEVKHPAAKSVIELSRTQDERVGDGTTSVVVLTGELMAAAAPIIFGGEHPTRVVASYRKAADLCLSHLKKKVQKVNIGNKEELISLAKTALNTKYVSRFGKLIPNLAVSSVLMVSKSKDDNSKADIKELIKVEKVPGGDIEDSCVLEGIMISKDILHSAMRRKIENPKILMLDFPLEYKKAESETNIEINKATDWRRYLELEEEHIRSLCSSIRTLKVDVVVCEKGVSDIAQHFLLQSNISVIRRVRKSDLHRLAFATGGRVCSRPEKMSTKDVGTKCALFEVRKIGDDYWTFFDKCKNPHSCSILLRGASKDGLAEIERNLADAIGVIKNLLNNPLIVPGGGACESSMAAELRRKSAQSGESLQAFTAAANALETIPKTLAENAGAKVCRVLAQIRTSHDSNKNCTNGINGDTGKMEDMKDLGIWEPLAVKEQTATVLLRIDDVLSGISKASKVSGTASAMQPEAAM